MSWFVLLVIIGLIALIFFLYAPKREVALKVGDKAPNFTLFDDNGKRRSLSEFKGSTVVLYFYPKDNTPGCTIQACSLRDTYPIFQETNIVVIGINYETSASHQQFKAKNKLPFILLSDEEKKVAKKYGAYLSALNNLYPERKTFLIDSSGHIIKIFDNIDVTTHTDSILAALGISTEPQKTIHLE